MSNLHIVYGFCENQHKARLFNHLIQKTAIIRVKTIGHVANKAVFARADLFINTSSGE